MQINEEKEMSIEEFFTMCEENEGLYQIETPDGWQDIGFLVKKRNKKCYNLILESGSELGCSESHEVLTENGWKTAKKMDVNLDKIMTKNGLESMVAIESIGIRDTFDLNVQSNEHRYYSNNIVSHNCGKSLIAKASAAFFGLPLLKLDFGALFRSHVGESEETTRSVLRLAEGLAPSTLWIDEIDKGLSGTQSSGSTDGGTTDRVVSTFLTWMEEKKKDVFVVATANEIEKIPTPFFRRFDEIFFVDFPNQDEREEIAAVLIRRYGRIPENFDIKKIAKASDGCSGAEIEKAIHVGLFEAFADKMRELTTKDIVVAFKTFTPQYKMRPDYFDKMTDIARERGFVFANAEPKPKPQKVQKEESNLNLMLDEN